MVVALKECSDEMQPEEIQTKIYTVGKENGYKENLRDWFRLIYEVVLVMKMAQEWVFLLAFLALKRHKN